MSRSLSRPRRLGLETLERRDLLAGNVIATVDAEGQLLLRGDWQQNVVIGWSGVVENRVVLSGGKDYAGRPTLLNGSLLPQPFDGVITIRAEMYGPSTNRVLLTNLNLPDAGRRSVLIAMGQGNDQVVVSGPVGHPLQFARNDGAPIPYGHVNIGNSMYVLGGPGNDTVNINNATIGGGPGSASGFDGGAGNDSFSVDGSVALNRLGQFRIQPGTGEDKISIRRAFVQGLQISRINETGFNATDIDFYKMTTNVLRITLNSDSQTRLSMNTDAGERTQYGSALISLGFFPTSGAEVSVRRTEFTEFMLTTTSADDEVEIIDAIFNQHAHASLALGISLRPGDDVLALRDVTVNGTTELSGGAGFDRLLRSGNVSLGNATIRDFEEQS
jgi:hypothetical protein